MGSLMCGWDSHILDPKSAKYKRNKSLTKEEIDTYWKSKKKTEDHHLKSISIPSHTCQVDKIKDEELGIDSNMLQRSSSLPEKKTTTEMSLEEFINNNGWWKRSNWAFLNEPPVLEQTSNSYTSQFHVAKPANNEISAQLL